MKTNEIYNVDCLEFMKGMQDESVDLIVTDPPYEIIHGGCSSDRMGGIFKIVDVNGNNTEVANGKLFKHCEIKPSSFMPELFRILKNKTHCYIMVNSGNLNEFWNEALKAGFGFHNLLIWEKDSHTMNKWYMKNCEYILFLRKGEAKNINNMGSKVVFKVNNLRNKLTTNKHPTEKPFDLIKHFVLNSSNKGEIVFDPFGGSCVLAEVCLTYERDFIITEIDKKYYEMGLERLKSREKINKSKLF